MKKWALALIAMLGIGFVAQDMMQKREAPPEPSSQAPVDKPTAPPAESRDTALERSWPEPSARTRQLVTLLSQVDVRPGALSREKAAAWRRTVLELLNEGTAAVPAIAEYLQTNADLRFDGGPAAKLLREPTLRIALIKVLFDIPAPDNVDLQRQVLRVTTDPDEVVLLARQLEMQERGKHRTEIISAARASLDRARQGAFPGRDTSAVVTLLKKYEEAAAK